MDVPMQNFVVGQAIHTWSCIGATSEEYVLDAQGQLHSYSPDLCVAAPPTGAVAGATLQLARCSDSSTRWSFHDGILKLQSQPLCATMPRGGQTSNGSPVTLAPCGGFYTRQRWVRVTKGTEIAGWSFLPETSSSSLSARCSPIIEVDTVLATTSNAAWVKRVTTDAAVPLRDVFAQVCAQLYRDTTEAPDVRLVSLVFSQNIGGGVAYVTGTGNSRARALTVDLAYFVSKPSIDDLVKVWKHEATHVWQYIGARGLGNDSTSWEIEGLADFIRYRTGGFTLADRSHGGSYTDSYRAAGFFFDWIDRTWPGAMRAFNLELGKSEHLGTVWPPDFFGRTTGKSLDALWAQYQASF